MKPADRTDFLATVPTSARALHDAQLSYQLVSDQLQRACGRGGAPLDLTRAQRGVADTAAALHRLAEAIDAEIADG